MKLFFHERSRLFEGGARSGLGTLLRKYGTGILE